MGCPRNLQQGPPDKLSAIFLSQGCGGPGTSALLEHDLVMLTWLVVMTLLITSIEGDLEAITSLCLGFSFCFLKMGDKAPAPYPPERNFLRKWQ